jgi:peptidoglycan/xylan/chitin deacetylase (PgdA/CDA1 family)
VKPFKFSLIAIAVVTAIAAYFIFLGPATKKPIFTGKKPVFPELRGPSQITLLPAEPSRTSPDVYSSGSDDSLAIWVKDPQSSWLGLAHGLQAVGVPFKVYTEPTGIFDHDVIMAYPSVTGSNTDPAVLKALADHVQDGGTMIGFSIIGGGLPRICGFETSEETADLTEFQWGRGPALDSVRRLLKHNRIPLKGDVGGNKGLPGMVYRDLVNPPVASFSDAQAAITHLAHPTKDGRKGHAYAVGLDLGHFILRAHNGRFVNASETYVNDYQPILDQFLLWIKNIYIQGEPEAVTLWPTAHNKEFTALLTHDIDYTQSVLNISAYVSMEQKENVPATYFFQTKYVKDWNDDIFFTPEAIPHLIALKNAGMEIGNHTVSHSNEFRRMPIGTGKEQYPDYQPKVMTFSSQKGGSILGELRVTKFLLEELLDVKVRSFRPGHLSYPQALPQLLEATEHEFSSSMTANGALTHFPFRLMHDREYDAETGVLEIPITIEDEEGRMGDRLAHFIRISEKIGGYGGVVNVLIHTDIQGHKLEFERGFINHFRDRAWFATVSQFGDWWRAREAVQLSVESDGVDRTLHIHAPVPIDGLTLQLPSRWELAAANNQYQLNGNRLIIPTLEGDLRVPLKSP